MTKTKRLDRRRSPAALAAATIAAALAAGALAAGALATAGFPAQAETRATLPGGGVKDEIVFHSNRAAGKGVVNPEGDNEIFAIKADGTRLRQLTRNDTDDITPAYSPDGGRIAFTSYRDADLENGVFGGDVYVMRADGTGQARLTDDAALDVDPAYSPDGRQIAFTSYRNGHDDVYKMNADGTRQTNLTGRSSGDSDPDWSPDGRRIAFVSNRDAARGARDPNTEIYEMRANGAGQTRLTKNPDVDAGPAYSPDGKRIAFTRLVYDDRAGYNEEIYKMNADGTRQANLSRNPAFDRSPAWSPDGKRIAFVSNRNADPAFSDTKIHAMKSDGSRQRALTDGGRVPHDDAGPDWRPRR